MVFFYPVWEMFLCVKLPQSATPYTLLHIVWVASKNVALCKIVKVKMSFIFAHFLSGFF